MKSIIGIGVALVVMITVVVFCLPSKEDCAALASKNSHEAGRSDLSPQEKAELGRMFDEPNVKNSCQ